MHDQQQPDGTLDDSADGNHPSEIAARQGYGPLSPLASQVWHGESKPCVTCGQLVQRDAAECAHCGQNLQPEMIDKMRARAGPWYVLEHLRPFPGVGLDLIIRQIRRGLITETSIVRGPSTDYQWRYAVETRGLSKYFNRCWNCYTLLTPADTYCQSCKEYLLFDQAQSVQSAPNSGIQNVAATLHEMTPPVLKNTDDLNMLRDALNQVPVQQHELTDEPSTIAGFHVAWVGAAILVTVILGLIWITSLRSNTTNARNQTTSPVPQAVDSPQD